jgi:hypothetical protein
MSDNYPRGEVIKKTNLEKGATNVRSDMTIPSTYQPGNKLTYKEANSASKHIKHVNSYQVKCKSKGKGLFGTCHIGREGE